MRILKKLTNYLIVAAFGIAMFWGCKKPDYPSPEIAKFDTLNRVISRDTVSDINGNVYNTVTIKMNYFDPISRKNKEVVQTWMVENLRTTKYTDGSNIPEEQDSVKWKNAKLDKVAYYCNYNNTTDSKIIETYGRLYNWYVVDISNPKKIAPIGWHVANNADWSSLVKALGGKEITGFKIKEAGNAHWIDNAYNSNNLCGMSILPAGYRNGNDGLFYSMGYSADIWSVGGFNFARNMLGPWNECVELTTAQLGIGDTPRSFGFSVRCIKN